MLAMQYSFVLPADYQMAIIRQRIADKGHLLDNFPGLIFKVYLSADRNGAQIPTQDNLYAPFYVWENNEAMNNFLCSAGFAGVTQAFAWPEVKTWSVWSSQQSAATGDLAAARYATREILAIPPHTALADWRQRESALAQQAVDEHGALSAVAGFDPTSWTLVRFRLWHDVPPAVASESLQSYEVGHISLPLVELPV